MRILLVDNLVMPEGRILTRLDVHPHLGLLSLAAAAGVGGHSVQIYDPKRLIKWGKLHYDSTLYERVAADLLAERPDAIGFTTLGCSFLFALNVAALLKRREPELPILLGGPHATMLHRQILERFAQFDVVVRHEADEIFSAVLDNLEHRKFESIPGISWRGSGASRLNFNPGAPKVDDLDRLPITSYEYYPISDLGLDLLRIEAGRGCPFMCTFCSTASFFQRSFRIKSADRLVAELDRLHWRYGFSDFKLDHDLFTVNRRKVLEFCEAVKGRGYRWRASARIDCVDTDLLGKMAEAGCVELYFGIETGSPRMQQIAKKRLDLGLVAPTLETAEGLKIRTTASFITGYPEECEQDQNDTLDLLGRCFRPSCLPQLHILSPEPGTPMFDELSDRLKYDGYADPYNAYLVGPNDERLVSMHPDIFPTYYYYPAVMPRSRYTFAVEAVAVLRRVGPIVLAYALRAYGGRLSRLVQSLRVWANENGQIAYPDAGLVEAYVSARFGQRHHVTSLFRYAFALHRAAEQSSRYEPSSTGFDPTQTYQVGSHLRRLPDLHDCALLLDLIRRDRSGSRILEESETGEYGAYLVSARDGKITTYRIDSDVDVILELFEQPRTCSDVADSIRDCFGTENIDARFFAELVDAGLLVPKDRTTDPSIRNLGAPRLHAIDG